MYHSPKLTPEEYRQEWLNGLHQTEYNACRFAEDKTKFAVDWLLKQNPKINLDEPKNILDRICWCKIFDKDPRKPLWTDKINANYMLHELGLDELIIEPVYFSRGYLTRAEYDALPDGKYIIKCNHGSGWNIKFHKNKLFDPAYMISKIHEWYDLNFAYISGYEWQYENIIPGIIIQPDFGELLNWEFYCENGNIEGVNLIKKEGKNWQQCIAWADENGNAPKFSLGQEAYCNFLSPKEKIILEKMKPYVKKLAQDFKFVRVDLYSINTEIKFSELTFSPCGGIVRYREYES